MSKGCSTLHEKAVRIILSWGSLQEINRECTLREKCYFLFLSHFSTQCKTDFFHPASPFLYPFFFFFLANANWATSPGLVYTPKLISLGSHHSCSVACFFQRPPSVSLHTFLLLLQKRSPLPLSLWARKARVCQLNSPFILPRKHFLPCVSCHLCSDYVSPLTVYGKAEIDLKMMSQILLCHARVHVLFSSPLCSSAGSDRLTSQKHKYNIYDPPVLCCC